MASQPVLQFVPGSQLSREKPLQERISKLLTGIPMGGKRGPIKGGEEYAIREALPLMALAEDWTGIVDVASKAVSARCSFNLEIDCYRAWIEALRATHELESLQFLAKHLLSLRAHGSAFVSLSLIALTYCGRMGLGRVLCRALQKQKDHTQCEVEAIAAYLSVSLNPALRQKSVRLQRMLADAQPGSLWIVRNYLHGALENDAFEDAARAFKLLHAAWPEAAEPYWSAASLAALEGAWGEAATTAASLIDAAGESGEATVVLAQCYEMAGDLLAASKILHEKADAFDDGDYEFHATYGTIQFKLHGRYPSPEYRTLAVRHLAKAAACASAFGISDAPIQLMLHALHAGVGETRVSAGKRDAAEGTGPRYWLLEVDDKRFEALVSRDFGLSSVPAEISKGDTIVLARHDKSYKGNNFQVVGWMQVESDAVPDCVHGPTAMTGVLNTFLEFIPAKFESGTEAMGDPVGCHNFAREGLVKYYRLTKEAGQGIFLYADKMYASYSQKGTQHAL